MHCLCFHGTDVLVMKVNNKLCVYVYLPYVSVCQVILRDLEFKVIFTRGNLWSRVTDLYVSSSKGINSNMQE